MKKKIAAVLFLVPLFILGTVLACRPSGSDNDYYCYGYDYTASGTYIYAGDTITFTTDYNQIGCKEGGTYLGTASLPVVELSGSTLVWLEEEDQRITWQRDPPGDPASVVGVWSSYLGGEIQWRLTLEEDLDFEVYIPCYRTQSWCMDSSEQSAALVINP